MALSRDQTLGALILVLSILGIVVYGWFVYVAPVITLQITALVAVGAVLVILAWIGWVMATTPPPAPLEPELAPMGESSETKAESG